MLPPVQSSLNSGDLASYNPSANGRLKSPGHPDGERKMPLPCDVAPTDRGSLNRETRQYNAEFDTKEAVSVTLSHTPNVSILVQKQKSRSVESYSKRFYDLMKQRKFDLAEKLLRAILEQDPDNLEARNGLGWALLAQSNWAAADDAFRQVLEKQPDNLDARCGRGWARIEKIKEYEATYDVDTENAFRKILRGQPDNLVAQGGLAELLGVMDNLNPSFCNRKKFSRSQCEFHRILQKHPDNLRARLMFGLALQSEKRHAEAEREFRQVLEKQPDNLDARGLVEALIQLGKTSEAIAQLRQLLDRDPSDKDAIIKMKKATSGQQIYEEEMKWREVLASQPDHLYARRMLGRALCQQANYVDAEEQFRRVLNKQPDNLDAKVWLGWALYHQSKILKAEAEFRCVLEMLPQNIEARRGLGLILFKRGRYVEAEVEYRRLLDKQPDNLFGRAELGLALQRQSKNDEAEVELRKALKTDPEYLDARIGLAKVLNAKNKYTEAEVIWRGVLEAQPNQSDALLGLEWTLYCLAAESNDFAALQQIEDKVKTIPSSIRKMIAAKRRFQVLGVLRKKNIEFLRELHRIDPNITKDLLFNAITSGLSQEYVEIVLKNSLFDPAHIDWEGQTALHIAVLYNRPEIIDMLKQDPKTQHLVESVNIYGEKPVDCQKSNYPNVSQATILENLKVYAKLKGSESEIDKIFFEGHCNGFSFLYTYYRSIGKVDQFYQVLYAISAWDKKVESLKEPISIGGFANREACFEQWVNDIVHFQYSSPIVSEMDPYVVLDQNDRVKQFALVGPVNSSLKLFQLDKGIDLPNPKKDELVEILTFLTLYSGFSFELAVDPPPLGHKLAVYIDKLGGLHFYDSNHTKRLKEEQDPAYIERILRIAATYLLHAAGVDGPTPHPIGIYGYCIGDPSQIRRPTFDEADKLLKAKSIKIPVSAFALIVGDKELFKDATVKEPQWQEYYKANRSVYEAALRELGWCDADSGMPVESSVLAVNRQDPSLHPIFLNYWLHLSETN